MSLQFDQETGKITYRGKEVGECILKDDHTTVRLDIEYAAGNDWIIPLSWFAYGLSKLPENQPGRVLKTLETAEDSIAEEFSVLRYCTEKYVKRGGYKWDFHKTDVDDWPSPLHGHDYDKGLKLDVITGKIYDVGTKKLCKKLKPGVLQDVQSELRKSKDFGELVATLIDQSS